MLGRLKNWINKPSGIEGESDNLLFLTRYLLLFFLAHTIFIGISSAVILLPVHAVIAFVVMMLFHICFQLTYRSGISTVAIIVSVICGFYITCFSLTYGWRSSFPVLLFVVLAYLWYDIAWDMGWKVFFSILSIALFILIHIFAPAGVTSLSAEHPLFRAIACVNIFFSFTSLSLILYFFCTQFAEAERKLYLYNRQLKKIAETDPLTKLPNRRFALDELKQIENNYVDGGRFVSIAIGDIDFFKKVNDNYGHEAGDLVLSTLAALFASEMDGHGFAARWGGEEFLFVYDHANGDEAYLMLDELREKVSHTAISYGDLTITVNMTFGVEEYGPRAGIDATISAADKKLYLGKSGGRNRVVY